MIGLMTMYHWTTSQNAEQIIRDGELRPSSCGHGDINDCEMRTRLFGDPPCDHVHEAPPPVLWLTEHPWAKFIRRGYVRFEVSIPSTEVQIWGNWALENGAEPAWVKIKSETAEFGEWVTESSIPQENWITVYDVMQGKNIPFINTPKQLDFGSSVREHFPQADNIGFGFIPSGWRESAGCWDLTKM